MQTKLCLIFVLIIPVVIFFNPIVCNENADSTKITFSKIPEGESYQPADEKEENKFLEGWYTAVKTFVKIVQPNKPPVEMLYKYVTGNATFEIPGSVKEILELEKGFVACIIFGLLFIIAMPIVGLVFCSCRICGNCGGKRVQEQTDHMNCFRRMYLILLFITFATMSIAVVNMYACNQTMDNSIEEAHKTIIISLDDSQKFINNTYMELDFLVQNSVNLTVDQMINYLDNVKEYLGEPVKNVLQKDFKTDEMFDMGRQMAQEVQPVYKILSEMIKSTKSIVSDIDNELKQKLNDSEKSLDKFKKSCNVSAVAQVFGKLCKLSPLQLNNPSAITMHLLHLSHRKMRPAMSSLMNFGHKLQQHEGDLQKVQGGNITHYVIMAQNEFKSVPEHVKKLSQPNIKDVKSTIESERSKIQTNDQLTQLEDIRNSIVASTNDAKADVDKVIGTLQKYNKYRWGAGIGICIAVSLCVALILLGMCCGVLGHKSSALPSERNFISNAGGLSLMAAVGFMFIFASLLMIITSVFFLIGAHGEAFLCDVMYNDIPILNKIKSIAVANVKEQSFIKDMNISTVLSNCKKNEAAYTALDLEKHFNITAIKDLINQKEIGQKIENMNLNLTNVHFVPKELQALLNTYVKGVDINFTSITIWLEKTVLSANATDYYDELEKAKEKLKKTSTDPKVKQAFQEFNNYADDVGKFKGILSKIDAFRYNLLTNIEENSFRIDELNNNLTVFNRTMNELKGNVSNDLWSIIKEPIQGYKVLLLSLVDQFIDHLDQEAKSDVAKCKPIWNVYSSTRYVICKLFFDPFNGFWFGLGWIITFFIPAIILSVKLAKHFKRMEDTDLKWLERNPDVTDGKQIEMRAQNTRSRNDYENDAYEPANRAQNSRPRNAYESDAYEPAYRAQNSRPRDAYENDAYEPAYRARNHGPPSAPRESVIMAR